MKTVKYKDKTETNLMTEGDAPTETPAMANLTLQSNGTTKATYNGKTATTFNVKAADIGAAASSHTHTYTQIIDLNVPNIQGMMSIQSMAVVKSTIEYNWRSISRYGGTTISTLPTGMTSKNTMIVGAQWIRNNNETSVDYCISTSYYSTYTGSTWFNTLNVKFNSNNTIYANIIYIDDLKEDTMVSGDLTIFLVKYA